VVTHHGPLQMRDRIAADLKSYGKTIRERNIKVD
jgi:hypothetical protein